MPETPETITPEEITLQRGALEVLGIASDCPRSEMSRRIINQASHIQAYAKCLDDLEVKEGVDGCRDAQDIRRAFENLKLRLFTAESKHV